MEISVVCSRLNDNTFVRSYLLLQTLEDVDISVYGLVDDAGLYPFFEDSAFDFHTLPTSSLPTPLADFSEYSRLWRTLRRELSDTDLLYFASGWKDNVFPGLLAERTVSRDVPTLLDVYDYTAWFGTFPFVNPSRWFDTVIASNTPLADKIDGRTVYTPVDTNFFDPARYDREAIRGELGFDSEEVVLGFIGTPRESKGVHHLIEAVNQSDDWLRGLVVGAGNEGYAANLRSNSSNGTVIVEPVPHSEVPRYYAALDLLVLAQERSPLAKYQIPAKLFESMSMAIPVIGTAVGDLPSIIDGTGASIARPTPENIIRAARLLREQGITEMGRRARERVVAQFSEKTVGKKLDKIISNSIQTGR